MHVVQGSPSDCTHYLLLRTVKSAARGKDVDYNLLDRTEERSAFLNGHIAHGDSGRRLVNGHLRVD